MRNKIVQLFLLAVLTVGIAGAAQAQTGSPYNATIPFDFTVAGKSFEAGDYSISFGVIGSNRSSFLIRSADGKETAIISETFAEDATKPIGNARIVFDKDGDNYSLTQIKTSSKNIIVYGQKKKQNPSKVTGVEVSMLRK